MSGTIPQMPHFFDWWREANDHAEHLGVAPLLYGDARYWFERSYSPTTAAELNADAMSAA